ncbi:MULTISPECIES: ribonuclease III [Tepidanaerobacter]|uniref:Ribonuclease 3 n=1 Tax=Tepidanaerobacter syntrophicus TaxID=224999 RepID=A0A0U9HHK3_9FIRM|nr:MULTISPECIES: ribonuclease III [Tepidanaerobacter]GAQ26293.1 ribonuclease-3 [Tepidanaerobacter syntrophicus]GLI19281.1 ribonuclease 3 [Tepidanaerobacter syntrophicus]GLI50085.1 ribonuclease 3 [Tepidanaerobacter syntrophicus]HHV84173.1 ribonuclease III [Tepidanaerobacter syntrophicus]
MSMDEKRLQQLTILEEKISIKFSDISILNQAFVHPSLANEKEKFHQENNQRLEFLGDAVLELAISEYLYRNYDFLTEGQMTKVRAFTVCESSLANIARQLALNEYLILSKGEENTGGREKASILADTFEALIGAIYIDKGYKIAYDFIIKNLEEIIKKAVNGKCGFDYKTDLQELLQKFGDEKIIYNVISESGPDHDKLFQVEVVWKDKILGKGGGKSKKQAEQMAAKAALDKINFSEI